MTTLRLEAYTIPAADLGPENPLPMFREPNPDLHVDADDSIPAEDRRYLGWRAGYRVLPYRLQDGYNRDKKQRAFNAAVLENEFLRAIFLPELGGRLVSLVHKLPPLNKGGERELLDCNPVFQPANLALRNAWFSGGIEFNAGHFGHHYLTCAPIFAARVTGIYGEPVLRMYEWDRVKGFAYQMDFHLPPGSRFLFARMRIINPHDAEIPMYWWTNIAVPERADARVLVPAEKAFGHSEGNHLGLVPLPRANGPTDVTYSTNLAGAREFFYYIPNEQRRWVAQIDREGRGFVQTSTARLRGRKMFCWGTKGGRRWQEFLAEPGCAYLEIQAGLARTQLESVPMPALAQWTWTEAFGLLETNGGDAHSEDWSRAWRSVDASLESALPQVRLDELDAQFAAVTTRAPDEILARGSGWGALERRRGAHTKQADRIPPELVFDNLAAEQAPWMELLEKGALPEPKSSDDPGAWMVQPEWRSLLEASVALQIQVATVRERTPPLADARGSDNWLAWLHLGNMRLEALDRGGAREAFERSLQLKRTSWALRNLAFMEGAGDENWQFGLHQRGVAVPPSARAVELMRQAWEAGPRFAALAIEMALMLLQRKDLAGLHAFTQSLSPEIRANERIRLLSAKAALEAGALDEVESIFGHEFATIREGEVSLTDLWFGLHERRVAAREGAPIDEALRKRVRREFPPPRHLDFRMAGEVEVKE